MRKTAHRLSIRLDEPHSATLRHLSERTHVPERVLAKHFLTHALADTDSSPGRMTRLLDRLPGAHDRAQVGLDQAKAGRTVPLDQL